MAGPIPPRQINAQLPPIAMVEDGGRGGARLLDREGLVRALDGLSERLRQRGLSAKIHIAGGAAMILAHRRTRATQDVDAMLIEEREAVLSGAREVATEQGLAADWVNDSVRDH